MPRRRTADTADTADRSERDGAALRPVAGRLPVVLTLSAAVLLAGGLTACNPAKSDLTELAAGTASPTSGYPRPQPSVTDGAAPTLPAGFGTSTPLAAAVGAAAAGAPAA
ncbi:hypothetical protein FrCorBMG51_15805, partial [Protofrankia coriariae]